MLYLTNNNFTVKSSDCTIGGTNNAKVVGIMDWSNSATGGGGTQNAGTSWTISGIPLAEGQILLQFPVLMFMGKFLPTV